MQHGAGDGAQCVVGIRGKGKNVAYATKMAAALSGATVSQLRHWSSLRTGPLLVTSAK